MTHFLDDLKARGLVFQSTDEAALREHLNKPRTLYCGFDPTADSLHIGSLVPLLTLKRFQMAGHRPIVLVGGATGLIGDPSFKNAERKLNAADVVATWVEKLKIQTSRFVSFEGQNPALIANNFDWTSTLDVIGFLRDIGKHFSVNAMLGKESVKTRLENPETGISYTEFSYMVLQGMDFRHLHRAHNCTLQIGGSDQWGNMTAGTELIRKCGEATEAGVHVMTLPLVTKSDGSKFGKTETGTIWLDGAKTSPYAFYQFWLNTADADVEKFLKYFTFLPLTDIADIAARHAQAPHERLGQRTLAQHMTNLVHGEGGLVAAERISEALFNNALDKLTADDLAQLKQDGMPFWPLEGVSTLVDALVSSGLAESKRKAREFISAGAVSHNGNKVTDETFALTPQVALYETYHLLKRGKKEFRLLA